MKSWSRRGGTKSSVSGPFRGSKGLAIVEEHIRRHDEAMISDCDEDINALLILGGLFSTILTAFISVSLGWFNQDYTQTTAQLLQQISNQLANNTSPAAIAEPPSFEVATIDVAINILWFLSLVLCLAASLFGMIVKGWLREYSMWETEPAQDAIWLRQIRYKAFLQWKVPLIVALLPGLLELALVLFMAGIVALLWTLNSLLALVVSIVSAVFAIMAFSMVIVPAFFPHCPYRSPAGWTCVVLRNALVRALAWVLWLTGWCSRPLLRDTLNRYQELEDWKKRDLHIDILAHSDHGISSSYEMHTSKLLHLVDALAWTFDRCQNDVILRDLHFSLAEEMSPAMLIRLPLYVACRKFSLDSEEFFTTIHSQYTRGDKHHPGTYILSLDDRPDILDPSHVSYGVIFLEILGLVLLDQMQSFIRSLALQESTPWDVTNFVDALCFLLRVARLSPFSRVKIAYSEFLVELYHTSTYTQDKEGSTQNIRQFRTLIIELLMKIGSIRLSGGRLSVDMDHTHMTFRDYTNLAINVTRENSGYVDPESRHLFVTLSNIAIRNCTVWYTSHYNQDDLRCLMQCLEDATSTSLALQIPNCGYYSHLPWIASLSHAARLNPGLYAYIPLSLLRVLEESIAGGLIAGDTTRTRKQLDELITHCACRETVVVTHTPDTSQVEGGPNVRIAPDIPPDDAPESREPAASPSPAIASALGEPQEDGGFDSSCRTPLLSTPSSGTLAENTPNLSPCRSTLSLDRAL